MSSKSDDFSLRYGDITIFKMVAVRYLGIVLPPYETTQEVSVAGRSFLSNIMTATANFFTFYTSTRSYSCTYLPAYRILPLWLY